MNEGFTHRKISIPEEKVRDYLLSPDHPSGKYKARWFISKGYTPEFPAELEETIVEIAEDGTVQNEIKTEFGVKYIVIGEVESPTGVAISLVTVWIEENESERIRFVTAYPASEQGEEQ